MLHHQKPSKEQVRDWLAHEVADRRPPPSPERIREQLGWKLIEAEKNNFQSRPDFPCFETNQVHKLAP